VREQLLAFGVREGAPFRDQRRFDAAQPRLEARRRPAQRRLGIDLELLREPRGCEQQVAEFGLEAALDGVLPVLQPALDQCVVISFDADFVRAARDRTGCRIGWAIRSYDEASHALARELAPEYVFCNHEKMPAMLWAGDWVWVAYEVTNAALARDLIDRGCGMLETMLLPELRAELAQASE